MTLFYAPAVLHTAIAAVCPIDGIWIGDPTNAATWGFWPTAVATPAQIAAATKLLAAQTPVALAAADAIVAAAAAAIPNPLATAHAQAVSGLPTASAVPSGA
jgi:hypothetical protein